MNLNFQKKKTKSFQVVSVEGDLVDRNILFSVSSIYTSSITNLALNKQNKLFINCKHFLAFNLNNFEHLCKFSLYYIF